MAGRALVFSRKSISKTIARDFIPVAADDWYSRRRSDRIGTFFREIVAQREDSWDGDSTRQGLYCLTSDGHLLAFRNTTDPGSVERLIERALERWNELDPKRREPRELTEKLGDLDPRYGRRVPEGALVVRVHARELERTDDGSSYATCSGRGRYRNDGSIDHLWIRRDEIPRLLPPEGLGEGESYPLDPVIAHRIARFHLVDNTRGEPPMWRRDEVRELDLRLTVGATENDVTELLLSGKARLATEDDDRGFEAEVAGRLRYERMRGEIVGFDAVAIGEHWGEGRYTPHARPGRAPLGIAFVLADGTSPADGVPPQASRNLESYYRSR